MILVIVYNPPSGIHPDSIKKALTPCLTNQNEHIEIIMHTEGVRVSSGGCFCTITLDDKGLDHKWKDMAEINQHFKPRLIEQSRVPITAMNVVVVLSNPYPLPLK